MIKIFRKLFLHPNNIEELNKLSNIIKLIVIVLGIIISPSLISIILFSSLVDIGIGETILFLIKDRSLFLFNCIFFLLAIVIITLIQGNFEKRKIIDNFFFVILSCIPYTFFFLCTGLLDGLLAFFALILGFVSIPYGCLLIGVSLSKLNEISVIKTMVIGIISIILVYLLNGLIISPFLGVDSG